MSSLNFLVMHKLCVFAWEETLKALLTVLPDKWHPRPPVLLAHI